MRKLVRSESSERPGLLENVLRRGAQLVSGGMAAYGQGGSGQELPGLRGAFFRADGQPLQPAITPAADQSDASILNTELARYFISTILNGRTLMPRLNCLTIFVASGKRLREDLVGESFKWLPRPQGSMFSTDSDSPKTPMSSTSAPEPTETPLPSPGTNSSTT